jgi:uncharacterized membrane protein YhfC
MQSRTRILLNLLVWIFIALLALLAIRISDARHWAAQHHFSLRLLVLGALVSFIGVLLLTRERKSKDQTKVV